jgi:hypothetical protein
MTYKLSPTLTQCTPCPSVKTFYDQAPKTKAASLAMAAIGFFGGNLLAWAGSAITALTPLVSWYKTPAFTMSKTFKAQDPLQQLRELQNDLVTCGLDGENRAFAQEKLKVLRGYHPGMFGFASVAKDLMELEQVLSRKDDKITLATLNYDMERLYFRACMGEGNLNNTFNSMREFLLPFANNPVYKIYLDKLDAIRSALDKTYGTPANRLCFETRSLLLGVQKGTIPREQAWANCQEIQQFLGSNNAVLLADEITADLKVIRALLIPAPTAPTTPIYGNAQPPRSAAAPAGLTVPFRSIPAPTAPATHIYVGAQPALSATSSGGAASQHTHQKQPESAAPAVRKGLPNFGRARLYNVCWMNSACQLIFHSPLMSLIDNKIRMGQGSAILQLLANLRDAQAKGRPESELQNIQEQMIDLYEPIGTNFQIGEQHDPYFFLSWVARELGVSCPMTVITPQDSGAPAKTSQATLNIIPIGYKTGKDALQCILTSPTVAVIQTTNQHGIVVNQPMTRLMSEVPRQILFRFTNFQNRNALQQISHEADFSPLFTQNVRNKHQNLRYRLVIGDKHSNPGAAKGHYTAQEREGLHYYDDRSVSQVSVPTADRNFSDSPIQLWELCQ